MDSLDSLQNIQQTETPPFLLARIQQKIKNNYENRFSQRVTWSLGLGIILVLLLNILVLTKTQKPNNAESGIVSALNLLQDNSIY